MRPDALEPDRGRDRRVAQAFGGSLQRANEVVQYLEAIASCELMSAVVDIDQDTIRLIEDSLDDLGIERDDAAADRVRHAMVPVTSPDRFFDGAAGLLADLRTNGLRTVAISNTFWRSADDYAADFERAGIAPLFDGIVTSFDERVRKPDIRIFEKALRLTGTVPDETVMVGNSERMDIQPAVRLGMRSVLVAIEDERPPESKADAVVESLDELRTVLEGWGVG